jgi:hypothetical protein
MGKTVYAFSQGPAFLLLCLIWTLCTLWFLFLQAFAAPVLLVLMIPAVTFCVGLWIAALSTQPVYKRKGLSLASGSILAAQSVLTVVFAALCFAVFYGIFLCTTDRDSYNQLFSTFRLAGVLFFLLLFGILYLNQLRKVVRTAYGTLRGNRGMPKCSLLAPFFSLVFGVVGMVLAFSEEKLDTGFSLLRHALLRMPAALSPVTGRMAAVDWSWIPPALVGLAVALGATAVILVLYLVELRRGRQEVLRRGTETHQAVSHTAHEPPSQEE